MSLDYTTLQSTVLARAARSELTAEVVEFIRDCEAMIRREVKAIETRVTLDDTDRASTSTGIYTLPDTIQDVRAVYATNSARNSYVLENVGVQGIRMLSAAADPRHYAVFGSTLEIRGVPGTDAEIEVAGLGWPDALATTATNSLLTSHEDLYVYGTLFHLYNYTQDLELAQSALSVFTQVVASLNRLIARKTGGGSLLPAYNLGHARVGRSY